MKTKLKSNIQRDKIYQTIAIIGEGSTEKHYFDQLKEVEKKNLVRKNLSVLPQRVPQNGYKCTEIINKAISLIEEYDFDYIFCVIDYDTICYNNKNRQNFEDKMTDLLKFIDGYNERNSNKISLYSFPDSNLIQDSTTSKAIFIIKNMPCLEYWYLLHFKYTDKPFETCSLVENLIKNEKTGCIPGYDKTNIYYSKHNIYQMLKINLPKAVKNARTINKNRLQDIERKRSFSDLYILFEILGIK